MSHSRAPGAGSHSGRMLRRTLFGTLLVVLLVFVGTGIRVWQVARADDRRPVDMVVVLGAAQYHGEPSAVLKARLKQALELYQQDQAGNIVTVGGRQRGDRYTEAEAGREWLIEHGIPPERVVPVETGRDTLGSLRAVGGVGKRHRWDSALIVSDPWHSLRARTMAADSGLDTWTSPTRSGPSVRTREFQLQSIFRETGGLLYYRLTHAPAGMLGESWSD